MILERIIKNELLNKGTETIVVSDFTDEEFKTQFTEIFELQHYKKALRKKNMTILDIGANIGLSALYFKDYARMIYAIEPNNDYYRFLTANTGKYDNIKTFQRGFGLFNGTDKLISNGDEVRTESMFAQGVNSQEFQIQTIDAFFEENNIKHIDVMKIDVEGSEYPIFMSDGFRKVASKIDFIVGEAHVFSRLLPAFIPEILKEYGFSVKFLPYNNLFIGVNFMDQEGRKLTKDYTIDLNTIFYAWRKK